MSYLRYQSQNIGQKCQKIMSMFSEVNGRRNSFKSNKKENQSKSNQFSMHSNKSNKKTSSIVQKENRQSAQKPIKKAPRPKKMEMDRNNSIFRDRSNSSFVSASSNNKLSRLDRIMQLKVKPKVKKGTVKPLNFLNGSMNSLVSSRCSSQSRNKQNVNKRNQDSRLQKIMKIKVEKPKVHSTLINYEPRKQNRSISAKRSEKSISALELKECKKKIKKSKEIEEKEDRAWKLFERERDLRVNAQRKRQASAYNEERRREERFERLVSKQIKKIENSKEINLRKTSGFSGHHHSSSIAY